MENEVEDELKELLASDITNCQLCKEHFHRPCLLPCLHNVCKNCLETTESVASDKVKCPVCCAEMKLSGTTMVRTNYFLYSLQQLAHCQDDSNKQCDYCKYDEQKMDATWRCLECQDDLCESCATAHRRTKMTRNHKVALYKDIKEGKYNKDIRSFQHLECEKHPGEFINLFCNRCEAIICRECKVTEHDYHNWASLEEAGSRFRKQTTTLNDNIKAKIPTIDEFIKALDQYDKDCQENEEKLKTDVCKQAEKLHELIEAHKTKMVEQIEEACASEIELVNNKKEKLESTLQKLNTTTDYMNKLLKFGNNDELLANHKTLTGCLADLVALQVEGLDKKLKISFNAITVQESSIQHIFGKVQTGQARTAKDDPIATPPRQNIPKPVDYKMKTSQNAIEPVTISSPKTASPVVTNGINGPTSQPIPAKVTSVLPQPLDKPEMILCFECRGKGETKDLWPTGIAIDSDENMIILDRDNRRIKIFDKFGHFKHSFGNTGKNSLGCPYDVALLHNGNLAISDYGFEEIKIFTKEGEFVKSFRGPFKYPRGLAVSNEGHLIVTDCERHRVTIHDPTDGALLKMIVGKDDDGYEIFTDPYYVTCSSQDYIIVTDWAAPNIKIFSPDGEYLTQRGTYGSRRDQVLQPYGVCTDTYGHIFIADNQNHRIHLLTPDGTFIKSLITERQNLWHPMALAINNDGNLVVTEGLGKVKVFQYM